MDNRIYLRFPFVIKVADMSVLEITALVDKLRNHYDADFRFDADAFYGSLMDMIEDAKDPMNFLFGPYVGIHDKSSTGLAIFSSSVIPESGSCLTVEQLDECIIEGLVPAPSSDAKTVFQFRPGPKPFIVKRQRGQIYGYEVNTYRIMAENIADADRRLNALGRTLSIVPA